MDAHNLEPQEYSDRIKLYSHRLAQQWNIYQSNNELNGKYFRLERNRSSLKLQTKKING